MKKLFEILVNNKLIKLLSEKTKLQADYVAHTVYSFLLHIVIFAIVKNTTDAAMISLFIGHLKEWSFMATKLSPEYSFKDMGFNLIGIVLASLITIFIQLVIL